MPSIAIGRSKGTSTSACQVCTIILSQRVLHFIMQYDTVEKAVKSALNKFGKIDILVNCKSSSYII